MITKVQHTIAVLLAAALLSLSAFAAEETSAAQTDPVASLPVASVQQTETAAVDQATPQTGLVWISASGKKYHLSASCSGMKNPSQISRTNAEAQGRTPCKKCYK